ELVFTPELWTRCVVFEQQVAADCTQSADQPGGAKGHDIPPRMTAVDERATSRPPSQAPHGSLPAPSLVNVFYIRPATQEKCERDGKNGATSPRCFGRSAGNERRGAVERR